MDRELTPRERELIILVAHALDNRTIATVMDVAYKTVKNHMTSILRKTRLSNRVQVAVWALQSGMVELDEIELRQYEVNEWLN